MKALTFQIRTLQPLLVTQLGAGEENSSTAFNFIPGSVVRGGIIGRYLQAHRVADVAQDPDCRRLFFDVAVRYLNAYPVNRQGQRTLPKPLSWRVSKDERHDPWATVYDFAIQPNTAPDNPVLPSGDFCWWDEDRVEIIKPKHYVGAHNASENRNVKRKEDSTVYRYEAIAAGQVFGGVILAEDTGDLETLRTLLGGIEINLGGSRTAGYGRVRLENLQITPDVREYEPGDEPSGDIVILTLLSDVILRDENGQITTDLDAVLGWNHSQAYLKTRVLGGFNRKWGLPLVQTLALQAGTVLVYKASEVNRQLLQRLEREGLGERRAEGFGRMAVNWHTQAQLRRRVVPEDDLVSPGPLSGDSRELAQRMAERHLRSRLDQKLLEALDGLKITSPPSNAQLSRLRLAVHRAWQHGDPHIAAEHLKGLKGAKVQFERARIADNKRLLSWLIEGIEQNSLWQDYLQPPELPSIAGVTPQVTAAIKTEYTMRLLDALLQRTAREERSAGGGI